MAEAAGNYVEIRGLVKKFGREAVAVDHVSFAVKKGELLTLLGPSGCGKTTVLRCIGGLETPDEGEILIDGQRVTSTAEKVFLPPEKRSLGMVFQSYAIWPHMSVFSNVAYGLEGRGMSRKEVRRRVIEVLDIVGLADLADRNATRLSGGQQQRVALARALAFNPRLLLFDEPLSNLDAKLRERMRVDLKKLLREVGMTSIYVTHDQTEAMAISDSILVMNAGKIVQDGDPATIYNRPINKFVADFIGAGNFLQGRIEERTDPPNGVTVRVTRGERSFRLRCVHSGEPSAGKEVTVLIRPEKIGISARRGEGENELEAEVTEVLFLGNITEYFASIGEAVFRIQTTQELTFGKGARVFLRVRASDCVCLQEA